MKLAVLSLLFGVSKYAAAQTPVQFGCINGMHLWRGQGFSYGYCNNRAGVAANECCDDNWGYALGGDWGGSPMKTNHNEYRCLTSKPTAKYEVYEACDQPCPGRSMFNNPSQEGICGGGCKGCANFPKYESECISDKNIKCGELWSVYDCKQQEPKINSSEIVVRDESVADAAIDDDSNIGAADTDSSTIAPAAESGAAGVVGLNSVFILMAFLVM
eukprot:Lankesteria_metandrocarpae@DN5343_c0_g3_i1.p1